MIEVVQVLVNASYDYNFVTGNATADSHTIYFRTAPTNAQQVAVTYYGNSRRIKAIANSVIANGATVTGSIQMSISHIGILMQI